MRVHLREDNRNPKHTRFTLFLDGANCGTLVVNTLDANDLIDLVRTGCYDAVGADHTFEHTLAGDSDD